jgi:alpha-D-ribose 1-methylphosphonate 5-triphosphate synthase subunit PhnG
MERRDWMGVLARAPGAALAEACGALWRALGREPAAEWLRPPEFGAVMVRGRMGGTGAPFNLGEMTVTRATLRLADGTVGHAFVPGRDAEKARIAAVCDALLQGPAAEAVHQQVVRPMQALMASRQADRAAKAAATKVEFFTMVRGED